MLHPFNFAFDEDEQANDTSWYYRAMLALSLVILLFAVLTFGAPSGVRTRSGEQPVILLAETQSSGDDGAVEQYAPVGVWLPESPLYSCFVGSSQCCVISNTQDGMVITSETAPDTCHRVTSAIPLIPHAQDLALEQLAAPTIAEEGE